MQKSIKWSHSLYMYFKKYLEGLCLFFSIRNGDSFSIPNGGKIFFEEEVISNKSPEEIVDMGLIHVPEGRKLFPNLTVRDNLELGSYRRGKNNRSTNLEKVLEIFPKLSERISQTAGTLSGGEQQMFAIFWYFDYHL